MILKTLVTGVAAAAVVAAAAGGVTSVASSLGSGAPSTTAQIAPVVKGIPLPQAPAPELQAPLSDTINALGSGGPFSSKTPYLAKLPIGFKGQAERKYDNAVAQGYFPLTATVAPDVDLNGNEATAKVSATSSNGTPAGPLPLTFAQSPTSPTGWVLTLGSLSVLSAAMG